MEKRANGRAAGGRGRTHGGVMIVVQVVTTVDTGNVLKAGKHSVLNNCRNFEIKPQAMPSYIKSTYDSC